MSFSVVLATPFKDSLRRLEKKYPHVRADAKLALSVLAESPFVGALIPGARGIRKLRVRNSDLRRGKSGGYRLLYLFDGGRLTVFVLLMYAKSEREDVTKQELMDLLSSLENLFP